MRRTPVAVAATTTTLAAPRAQEAGVTGAAFRGRCYECGERGHMGKDCRGKKKETALLADVDNEQTLM